MYLSESIAAAVIVPASSDTCFDIIEDIISGVFLRKSTAPLFNFCFKL
jgi:hypothetical protein